MKEFLILLVLFILSQSCGYVGETPSLTSVKGGNIQLAANTVSSQDSNGSVIVSPNGTGNIGLGISPSSIYFFDVQSPTNDEATARFNQTTTSTNNADTIFNLRRVTSGSMANGFGSAFQFIARDSDNVDNVQGTIGFRRIGSDDSSGLRITTRNAGVATEVFTIDQTGVINIPQLTASLPVVTNSSKDLISSLISLTTHVTGVLPIANGGTNSSAALSGSSIAISNGSAIVQGAAGTTSTLLHGNAAGAPTYGSVALASEVSGTLPVANGGTGSTSLAGAGIVSGPASSVDGVVALFDLITGKLIKQATGTGFAKLTSGVLSTSSTVNAATELSGVSPIANGGTNSSTALSGSSIIVSNGTSIIQGAAGTTTTVLHGNAAGTPTYSAVSLVNDVTGILGIANGGIGASTLAGANIVTNAGTSTDNHLATFDSTTGKIIQDNSVAVLSDAGGLSALTQLDADNIRLNGNTVSATNTNGQLVLSGNGTGGTVADSGVSNTVPFSVQASTSETATSLNVLSLRRESTGDMTNGFGPLISFRAKDTAANTILGNLGFVRAGADDTGDFVVFPTAAGSGNERFRISSDGVVIKYQPAQTSKSVAVTLTIAELKTMIVQFTGSAANMTLPLGTDIEAGLNGIPTDASFDFSVINTGSGSTSLLTNTGLTLVGSMAVANGSSGLFRIRRTGTNTYTVYRIS